MTRTRLLLSAGVVSVLALLLIAAADSSTASAGLDQRATRTARADLASTATALKATTAAGTTRVAATATALKLTAAAAATQVAGTATALKATSTALVANVTAPATIAAGDAAAAIQAYADTVLGVSVTVKKAGGLSGTVSRSLSQTPNGSAAQSATAKLALKTYGATLSYGAASLSYGSGTISGDVNVDVQASSLGVYSLIVTAAAPADANAALELAKATFPALADFTYVAYPASQGYAWYAKGAVSAIDPRTKKVVTLAQAVIVYVVPGAAGKVNVSATVGRGEFATAIKAP